MSFHDNDENTVEDVDELGWERVSVVEAEEVASVLLENRRRGTKQEHRTEREKINLKEDNDDEVLYIRGTR